MDNNKTIILHYHLFKNAGTSIDSILKDNFDDQWVSKEFKNALSNSAQVTEWIQDNPNAIGDRVVESQRLMQAMMNNDDQLYGAVNQNVLQDVVVGDMLMR